MSDAKRAARLAGQRARAGRQAAISTAPARVEQLPEWTIAPKASERSQVRFEQLGLTRPTSAECTSA